MLVATIKGMLAHKLRLLLTSLSIALGVAFLSGTLILTDSMQRAFDDIFGKINAGTDVAVRPAPGPAEDPKPLSPDLLRTVRSVKGVASAEGQVEGHAVLTDIHGRPIQPEVAPTTGGSLPRDKDLRGAISLRSGRAPERSGEVAVDATSAKKGGMSIGSRITIAFQGSTENFTVVGIVRFAGKDDLGGSTSAYFDLATAQRVLGRTGGYDTIIIKATGGVADTQLRDRVSAALPSGFEAVTGKTLTQEASTGVRDDFLALLNKSLLAFAGIALFVGSFIIWNTFSMVVTQRSRELALLRAVGATRPQVMRTVLVEAFLVGVGASALGLGLGFFVARGLSAVMSAYGLALPTTTPRLEPVTVLASLLVGTLVTLVAAVAPALRATRVLPVEALRDSLPGAHRFSRRRLVVGVGITALATIALLAALFGGASVIVAAIGIAGIMLGVTALAPLMVRPLAAVIGRPLRARGIPGELARQNAMRDPVRTAATAMALMIGLTMVTSVTVFAASLKVSFHNILTRSTTVDLYLQPSGNGEFSRQAAQAVRDTGGVALVSEVGAGRARFGGRMGSFYSVDPVTVEQAVSLEMRSGSARNLDEASVLISRQRAEAQHWKVGDVIAAEFGRTGQQNLRVAGIFGKTGYFDSDYLISSAAHQKQDPNLMDSTAFVKVAPGADVRTVQDRIAAVLTAHPDTIVLDQRNFEKTVSKFIDRLFGLVTILLTLAVLIALLGIVNTMALSVFERTRELGLLRAVGMTRNQVRAMVRWEAVIISVIGAAIGIVLGIGLGVALDRALADVGIKWIAIPGTQLLAYVVLAAVAGVLAAIGPARRAARVDVLRAVVTE